MMGRRGEAPVGPDVWATCRELIPASSVFAFLAEHRDELFPESMFAGWYPSSNGRPSIPPQVLAVASVLQVLQNISDPEAAVALRVDLRWKAAAGLGLHDPGFDASLFVYFRRRLAANGATDWLFTRVRQVVDATGVLRGKRRRVLDSTVFTDAVATQDTVTQLIAAIRRVVREVPGAGEVVARHCTAHDYADPGKPRIAWDDDQARNGLVDALVTDAHMLLGHLPETEYGEAAANAVGLLALVAGQDVELAPDSDGRDGRWRIAKGTVRDRVISTVDPAARHIHKTVSDYRAGFKAHVCLEPQTGLFTAVQMRPGCGPEHHEAALATELLTDATGPLAVLGDCAYGGAAIRAELAKAGHDLFCKPAPLRQTTRGGFTLDDFAIDTAAGTATCPAGHTVALSKPRPAGERNASFKTFCRNCPLRERCTKAINGRHLTITDHHDMQAAARIQAATDPDWQDEYRQWRPAVERGIAHLTAHGRRLHYLGTIKNDAWLLLRTGAINLRRLINLGLAPTDTSWILTKVTN
ncbi:IS1182 family transposase [Catenulispora yoronensis]|uniref:IS1182 family transposase n=1 Tax=Catenulispora yoronensis TaxID=450799 RepID=UPI003CD0B63E